MRIYGSKTMHAWVLWLGVTACAGVMVAAYFDRFGTYSDEAFLGAVTINLLFAVLIERRARRGDARLRNLPD